MLFPWVETKVSNPTYRGTSLMRNTHPRRITIGRREGDGVPLGRDQGVHPPPATTVIDHHPVSIIFVTGIKRPVADKKVFFLTKVCAATHRHLRVCNPTYLRCATPRTTTWVETQVCTPTYRVTSLIETPAPLGSP